jgi:hypothetical protein
VAEGGHGGGARSVTAAAAPALLGWRWKMSFGPKRSSGPAQRPRPAWLIKGKRVLIFEFK